MGIPSYFSYIIKNHSNIIRNLNYHQNYKKTKFDSLYIDANSIIYDAYRTIEKDSTPVNTDIEKIEELIIEAVIDNIDKYISFVKPSNTIFIGFDGVAPFAKMEQQRTRRYKSEFMSKISFNENGEIPKSLWNTTSITPGTTFMNMLSAKIKAAFENKEIEYGVELIIVTPSTDPGEGEHKIYQHVREYVQLHETIAIYGLDSDLIMLSIYHARYCSNIYIFREAPEFANSIVKMDNSSMKLPLFLDINALMESISSEMDCKCAHMQRVHDYVFLCFLLGNDFLPHFPALNIRTNGIQILLDTYRMILGNKPDMYLIQNGRIQWKNLRLLLSHVAKHEPQYLATEYSLRDKLEKMKYAYTTAKEREQYFTNLPIVFRSEEKYICPNEIGWEDRYYKILLHETRELEPLKSVCNNYLEGLEWVYKYYTSGCPHWKWKYNYHYPPLVVDLIDYIPHYDTNFITENDSKPFSPYTQLSYVLPLSKFDLLPKHIAYYLISNYSQLYASKLEFQWAFCRYFWESHVKCKQVPIDTLETWDRQFSSQ